MEPLEARHMLAADLVATLSEATAPPAALLGTATPATVTVRVTNSGDQPTPRGALLAIDLFADPILNPHAEDTGEEPVDPTPRLLGRFAGLRASLRASGSRSFKLQTDLGTLPEGQFRLRAVVDAAGQIDESDETNNEAFGVRTLRVDEAFVDLAASMKPARLKAATLSGDGTKFRVPLVISNLGNTALQPRDVTVEIFARHLGGTGEADVILGTQVLSVRALLPGKSRASSLTTLLPMGLPSDLYVLGARLQPPEALSDPDADNDLARTAIDRPVEVTEGFMDLTGEFTSFEAADLLLTGAGEEAAIKLRVRNAGNLPVKQAWRVDLVARPFDATDDTRDVTLAELAGKSPLKPGKELRLSAGVPLSALAAGAYQVLARFDAAEQLTEKSEANTARLAGTLTLVDPVIDLVVDLNQTSLPAAMHADALVGFPVSVTVHNRGNTPTPAGLLTSIDIYSKLIEHGFHAQVFLGPKRALLETLTGVDVGGLAPGASRTVNATVGLQTGVYRGEWSIEAVVDPADQIDESNDANNLGSTVRLLEDTQSYAFSTVDQSMWGTGAGAFDTGLLRSAHRLDAGFTIPSFNVGLAHAEVFASTEGEVSVDFRARFDAGSVDVDFRSAAGLEIVANGTRTGNGKDNFTFWTRPLQTPTGRLATRSPNLDIASNLNLDLTAHVGARGAVVGSTFDDSFQLLDIHETFELLDIDNREITILGQTLAEADEGENAKREIDIEFDALTGKPKLQLKKPGDKKAKAKPHKVDPKADAGVSYSMGDLSLFVPTLFLETNRYEPIGQRILATGETDLVRLDADLDFLIVLAGGPPMGMEFDIADKVKVAADIFDIDVGRLLSLRQDFTFTGVPQMTARFSQPVDIKQQGTNVALAAAVTEYTADVGAPFDFEVAASAEELEIETEFHLDGSLRNLTDLMTAVQMEIDLMKVEAKFMGFKLADFTAFNETFRLPSRKLATVYDQTFTVGGFESVQGRTYQLDLTDRTTVITVSDDGPPVAEA